MLHAPTSESKQQSDQTRTPERPEHERELHPRLGASAKRPRAAGAGAGLPLPSAVAQLYQQSAKSQSTYGNQALLRMLDRSRLEQSTAGLRAAGGVLQAKLFINEPGDAYEQEADRVADAAMRMPEPVRPRAPTVQIASAPSLQRKCACGGSEGECAACKEEREVELQRAAQPGSVDAVPPIVYEVLRSPGQPLDAATRGFFEPRLGPQSVSVPPHRDSPQRESSALQLGELNDRYEQEADRSAELVMRASSSFAPAHDFGRVRIHTGEQAARAAAAVNALAFTVGSDIVFGANRYSPGTPAGDHLLAHELTHVVQQSTLGFVRRVQRELIYAGDYSADPSYKDDAEERANAHWMPTSPDFQTTAQNSGGGTGKITFLALLEYIKAKSAGSITTLGLIGHANQNVFALGGQVKRDGTVTASTQGTIDKNSIDLAVSGGTIPPLRDRFASNAKIILYACNTGAGGTLMQSLSDAFQVCVEGFSTALTWCIQFSRRARKIVSRGGVRIAQGTQPACEDFPTNITTLTPDKESCKGAAAAAIPKTAELEVPPAGMETPPETAPEEATV